MIKKGLLMLLILFISSCAGTIRIAESNGTNSESLTAKAQD